LAKLYQDRGLKVHPVGSHKPNEIADRIAEVIGLHVQTVRRFLNQPFKNEAQRSGTLGKGFVSAEHAIMGRIGSQQQDYGRRLIERFREEHEKELLESPIFRKKVLDMMPKSFWDEQVEELMRLREKDAVQESQLKKRQRSVGRRPHKKKAADSDEGYEPVGALYPVFIEECPECICSKCKHADTCIERVRADD